MRNYFTKKSKKQVNSESKNNEESLHSEIESRDTGVQKLISFDGIRSKYFKNTKKSSKYTSIFLSCIINYSFIQGYLAAEAVQQPTSIDDFQSLA
jgi:hypothetical protein